MYKKKAPESKDLELLIFKSRYLSKHEHTKYIAEILIVLPYLMVKVHAELTFTL